MDELKKILHNEEESKKIDESALLDYLKGNLSNESQNEFEQSIQAEDEFLNDALEGLKQKEAKNLEITLFEIDKNIKNQLKVRQKYKRRKPINNQSGLVSIIVILGLIVVAYVIIKLLLKK
jgi:anti-sigma-K factor RskA